MENETQPKPLQAEAEKKEKPTIEQMYAELEETTRNAEILLHSGEILDKIDDLIEQAKKKLKKIIINANAASQDEAFEELTHAGIRTDGEGIFAILDKYKISQAYFRQTIFNQVELIGAAYKNYVDIRERIDEIIKHNAEQFRNSK
jgi:hypothetical protein